MKMHGAKISFIDKLIFLPEWREFHSAPCLARKGT